MKLVRGISHLPFNPIVGLNLTLIRFTFQAPLTFRKISNWDQLIPNGHQIPQNRPIARRRYRPRGHPSQASHHLSQHLPQFPQKLILPGRPPDPRNPFAHPPPNLHLHDPPRRLHLFPRNRHRFTPQNRPNPPRRMLRRPLRRRLLPHKQGPRLLLPHRRPPQTTRPLRQRPPRENRRHRPKTNRPRHRARKHRGPLRQGGENL